jgi:hypothetical protein
MKIAMEYQKIDVPDYDSKNVRTHQFAGTFSRNFEAFLLFSHSAAGTVVHDFAVFVKVFLFE